MRTKSHADFLHSIQQLQPCRRDVCFLGEFKKLVSRGQSFALESTISGHTHIRLIRETKEQEYTIKLHYLWISSPLESIARVKQRVSKGGHHVPTADIRSRFARSLVNLADHYLPLADRWVIWDNQISPPKPWQTM
jgi:predicted ABC-type ATPase